MNSSANTSATSSSSTSTSTTSSSASSPITSHFPSTILTTPRPSLHRKQKLRSCLSPTRTPTGYMSPARPPSSRTTSFGSECSDMWKRTKSVRWEGENEGCEVTSYHHTWSAEEYDRTPLEPPSADERTCVLPERGSRCILTTYDCFSSSSSSEFVDDVQDILSNSSTCSSPTEEISHESFFIATPTDSTFNLNLKLRSTEETKSDHDEEESEEDRQWEECMERRRMMFAMRAKESCEHGSLDDRQPEFEGYRSISARLVEMLRDIESRRPSSPTDEDEADDVPESVTDDDDEDQDFQRGRTPFNTSTISDPSTSASGFVFTNLTSLRICEVDETEEELEEDGQTGTPSLISSSESVSEMETQLVSPRPSMVPVVPSLLASPTRKGFSPDRNTSDNLTLDVAVSVSAAQEVAVE